MTDLEDSLQVFRISMIFGGLVAFFIDLFSQLKHTKHTVAVMEFLKEMVSTNQIAASYLYFSRRVGTLIFLHSKRDEWWPALHLFAENSEEEDKLSPEVEDFWNMFVYLTAFVSGTLENSKEYMFDWNPFHPSLEVETN
jgi:hypothetical protein